MYVYIYIYNPKSIESAYKYIHVNYYVDYDTARPGRTAYPIRVRIQGNHAGSQC